MEKFLDRLGIYDLIGVWLTGVSILFLFLHTGQLLFGENIIDIDSLNNILACIVGAYFVGVVFQEIGNILFSCKTFHKNEICSICTRFLFS